MRRNEEESLNEHQFVFVSCPCNLKYIQDGNSDEASSYFGWWSTCNERFWVQLCICDILTLKNINILSLSYILPLELHIVQLCILVRFCDCAIVHFGLLLYILPLELHTVHNQMNHNVPHTTEFANVTTSKHSKKCERGPHLKYLKYFSITAITKLVCS